mmetsp:Transcript_15640/g.23686  ORF Transcript_15640/g.23686 Transcript_15640/m.23686 type:complete len:389 (-) Transcript_15640:1416-2582(-)|eukprot:CAMPEP_0178896258 /NCGR_PEP_ID=MMETSP0786-20121207/1060_1 /TAXON_ID=186022 /ORGANISM="Thalassionema frauenfeldii, Strain CCMP 1798" /LENGTH=388 /DNA_ID=CAMNT_0020566615 /DNA_START=115 /DNA_END=1284 /DNA_ORIENTATION=+
MTSTGRHKRQKMMRLTRVERVLGVTEEELTRQKGPEERHQYICRRNIGLGEALHFINIKTNVLTPIGSFSTPTLAELRNRVEAMGESRNEGSKSLCSFHCLYRIDIGELQTRMGQHDSMVQIAGNFNCLNVSSRRQKPDNGKLVELAHEQKTQGPAATFGPLAANLYRTHFCMDSYSGQTLDHQINLLDNVAEYTGRPINGKLTLTGEEKPIRDHEIDSIVQKIRVGLQTDCHVMYGRTKEGKPLCLLDENKKEFSQLPMIDQCHVAAVNWKSLAIDHNRNHTPHWLKAKKMEIHRLARMLLRACYEGIYLAALSRRTKQLYLTLVGGGVFGNPNLLIVEELARSHQRWANHPASCLENVYLCAYSEKDNVEDLLKAEGIDISSSSNV